jgi:hypothetical protein
MRARIVFKSDDRSWPKPPLGESRSYDGFVPKPVIRRFVAPDNFFLRQAAATGEVKNQGLGPPAPAAGGSYCCLPEALSYNHPNRLICRDDIRLTRAPCSP